MSVLVYLKILSHSFAIDPDVSFTFEQICKENGYNFQSFSVTISDGYILTLFRIPRKTNELITNKKSVVLLQHGLSDGADLLIHNSDQSIGFYYQTLGLTFGLRILELEHTIYNSKIDPDYWKFTWQDFAQYDLPATIDFILNITDQEKLTYIGYSQGGLLILAHLSIDPSFIDKLNLFIALAPITSLRNIQIPLVDSIRNVPVSSILEDSGIYAFQSIPEFSEFNYETCKVTELCDLFVQMVLDKDLTSENLESFPVVFSRDFGGTSTMNIDHYLQIMNSKSSKIQMFDYGEEGNIENYGQSIPPVYDFSQIPGPIALFHGDLDRLADPDDIQWLIDTIPSESIVYLSEEPRLGHFTFILGSATSMKYVEKVINLINQYQS